MKNNSSYKALLCASALSVLAACGSGGDSSSDAPDSIKSEPTNPEPTKNIGTFIDSPVINIGYRTETLEGITNELGEYEYLDGETVTFFIGDLVFSSVMAKGTVTPLDLAETTDVKDSKVVNMIRLLQTLDQDGNPDNGLTITDSAKSTATLVDFSLTVTEFESSSAVTSLLMNAGLYNVVTELVSATDAIEHFQQELGINVEFTSSNIRGKTFYWVIYDDFGYEDIGMKWNIAAFDFLDESTLNFSEVETPDIDTHSFNYSIENGLLAVDFIGRINNYKLLSVQTNYYDVCLVGDTCDSNDDLSKVYFFFDLQKAKDFANANN